MKPFTQFTPEEKKEFDKHPEIGVQMLQDKPYITKEVLDIIRLHEETLDGKGPLREKKLDKQVQIIALVNRFDRYVIVDKLPVQEAWKKIMVEHVGQYDLNLINKLKEILLAQKMW